MPEDIEARVIDHLEELGADFSTMPCDPELADTAAFCEHYGIDPGESANAILVDSRKPPGVRALCLVLATQRLDVNGVVRRHLGVRKISFASADITREVTGMVIGGVTPFGIPADIPVLVPPEVTALTTCIVGGGSRSMKVRVDPEVFLRMPAAQIVEGLAG
ncbi:MAG TPA: YbaK/EbsC family protein [Acidimicrobiia bacterium]|nr:YbaK/EbsC family protein [Acidimicrobiia bacterium]